VSGRAPVRIATRGSALALAQARGVKAACERLFPGIEFELAIIKTTGDRLQTLSLRGPPPALPKGLFTKELEVALLDGSADLAVHSLKDLPTQLPDGLCLGAVLPRADPRDVLVVRRESGAARLEDLPAGAVVATSSTRRAAQIRVRRPDLALVEIRGNVPTRLRKLALRETCDATLLAAAGLERLGIRIGPDGELEAPPGLAPEGWGAPLVAGILPEDVMLPAPGQAAIGIECRRGDRRVLRFCRALEDPDTRSCVDAERAFLAGMGGGCRSPGAALARITPDGGLRLSAMAFDGGGSWRGETTGSRTRPRALGRSLVPQARRALPGVGSVARQDTW